ncbi:hypothetical protein Cgig2_023700 [Carnegiea gigantea]|uniref:AP2/ERF domain-containing protein n=1 Tax=Carnegiea gigantea TaxID=171969 RepID=A0A9Q1KJZ1_9CARY|nr:hypothetical protein Cgig2_023700 [Carnegiea gigantea]
MSSNFTPCSKDEGKKGKMAESKKFKGVRQRHWGSWVSEIRHPLLKKRVWLGTFQSAEEAARAYDQAAVIMCGRRAKTNFPVSQALHEQGEPKYKLKYKGSSLASSSSSSSSFSSCSNERSLSHILHAKLRKPNKASSPSLTCLRLDTESCLIGIWQNQAGSSSKSKWVTTVKLEKKDPCEESNKAQAGQEEVRGEKASPSLMSNGRLLGHGHGHGCTFVDEEEESVSLQMIQELLHGNSTCF